MVFNESGITNQTIPLINKSIAILNSSKNILSTMDIPGDFSLADNLRRTIPTNINNTIDKLNEIKKWLQYKIDSSYEVERKNSQLLNSRLWLKEQRLTQKPKINTNNNKKVTTSKPVIKNSIGARFANGCKSLFSDVVDIAGDVADKAEEIGGKIVDKFNSSVAKIESTADKIAATGAKIGSSVKSFFVGIGDWFTNHKDDFKNIGATIWKHTKSIAATIANLLTSLIKGICQFIETLTDLVVMIGVGVASAFTGLYDAYQGIRGAITGEEWHSSTKAMWRGVMGYVAEDHVGNFVAEQYKNTSVGQWLDANAYKPFKSDGTGCKIGAGIGYVAGLIALTVATAGAGTAAVGAAGAAMGVTISTTAASAIASGIVVGAVTFSSSTASTWADQRDKSWEGIERAYASGEIDQATYENFKQINNMSDEDWQKIESAYQTGEITKEDYESLKAIKDMPKDWQTTDNLFAGFKEGTIEGAKAAVVTALTMGVGSKLSALTTSKLPSLLAKLPKGSQPVIGKLIGNVLEETSESAIQYGSDAATSGIKTANNNMGGVTGFFVSMGLGILLDIDLPKGALDVDVPNKQAIDIDLPNKNTIDVDNINKISLPDNLDDSSIRNIDFLADGSEADLGDDYNNFFENNHVDKPIYSPLTYQQSETVNQINSMISKGQRVQINYSNTTGISSTMLSEISDLSKVDFVVVDGLGDINGNLKSKYNTEKYFNRINYSGNEMKAIVSRLEGIQSRVDMNLPIADRAHQLYDILRTEIPPMRNYKSLTAEEMKVPQSLRGLTSENIVGQAGLICAGYSSVFKELCDRVGINADYVRGRALLDPLSGTSGLHAWNVVVTDEGIIPIDVTWGASGGGNWFGPSKQFADTHFADDIEEIYRVYDQPLASHNPEYPLPSNNLSEGNIISEINAIKLLHESSYPGQGIAALRKVVESGNYNSITRNANARTLIEKIPISDIERYIKINDTISAAVQSHDLKYGNGWASLQALINENGNFSRITSANGARASLEQFTIPELKQFVFGG